MADREHLPRLLLLAIGTGILFLGGVIASDLAARSGTGLKILWPGNAIVLGILISRARGRRDIAAVLSGGMIASLCYHRLIGDPAGMTLLFTVSNGIESIVAFLLLRRLGRIDGIFDRVSDLFSLVAACTIAAIASSTLGGLGLALYGYKAFADGWLQWYASSALSQLIVTPMVVIALQHADRRRLRSVVNRTIAEVILVLGLVAGVTSAVFLWAGLPLLFTVAPVVLLATFRLRAFGAAGAVAIVTLIAGFATAQGQGPIVYALADPGDQGLLLQLFLACCFLVSLPVAAMLTERDSRAEEAREIADRFKLVVENIGEVIFRMDERGCWAYLNPAWETLSGYAISDSLGCDWLERVETNERSDLDSDLKSVLAGEQTAIRRTARFVTAHGLRWVEIFVQGLRNADGELCGAAGTLRDIDDRKRLEEHVVTARQRAEQRAHEATLLASTDELTGLANRRAFLRQLDREIAGAAEFGWPLAVAIFDVDHFKSVNDRFGHAVGDRVLQLIAGRAGAAVRGGDLVGRLGGEEFGILMPGATAEDATMVAERLRQAIEMPRPEDAALPHVTVSIGIAARENQREGASLLDAADQALYAAKGAGRNRIQIAA